MTILIKDMEMPECCRDCELGGVYIHCDDNSVYTEEKHRCSVTFYPLKDLAKRHEKCPLIEVPTPHGRLGDLDRLYKHIKAECNIYGKPTIGFEDGNKVLKIIVDTRTVIEAEEG